MPYAGDAVLLDLSRECSSTNVYEVWHVALRLHLTVEGRWVKKTVTSSYCNEPMSTSPNTNMSRHE
ncbi:hypothetical protein PISMIDRAFT_671785 [Pisolithus microcarpus 441]|uniref:Uncharacterized protein n=1 Tax=Pisolithus microcarpus 441 TaxID=765257 RepID=A0A0C9ZUX8_9AGAM|nr:hypothetical protein PISMIDRAFT_671785 [Pisolithus microcarpus 441]